MFHGHVTDNLYFFCPGAPYILGMVIGKYLCSGWQIFGGENLIVNFKIPPNNYKSSSVSVRQDLTEGEELGASTKAVKS